MPKQSDPACRQGHCSLRRGHASAWRRNGAGCGLPGKPLQRHGAASGRHWLTRGTSEARAVAFKVLMLRNVIRQRCPARQLRHHPRPRDRSRGAVVAAAAEQQQRAAPGGGGGCRGGIGGWSQRPAACHRIPRQPVNAAEQWARVPRGVGKTTVELGGQEWQPLSCELPNVNGSATWKGWGSPAARPSPLGAPWAASALAPGQARVPPLWAGHHAGGRFAHSWVPARHASPLQHHAVWVKRVDRPARQSFKRKQEERVPQAVRQRQIERKAAALAAALRAQRAAAGEKAGGLRSAGARGRRSKTGRIKSPCPVLPHRQATFFALDAHPQRAEHASAHGRAAVQPSCKLRVAVQARSTARSAARRCRRRGRSGAMGAAAGGGAALPPPRHLLMQRHRQHPAGRLKRLLHRIAVVDIDINVQHPPEGRQKSQDRQHLQGGPGAGASNSWAAAAGRLRLPVSTPTAGCAPARRASRATAGRRRSVRSRRRPRPGRAAGRQLTRGQPTGPAAALTWYVHEMP